MLKHFIIKLKRYRKNYQIRKIKIHSKQVYDLKNQLHQKAITETVNYMYDNNLFDLHTCYSKYELLAYWVNWVDKNDIVAELWVYKWTTVNYIAEKFDGTVYGFDSFEWLPEDWWWKFKKWSFSLKKLPLCRDNVILKKWYFNKSLPELVKEHKNEKIGFLHIDCDLYSSTLCAFTELDPLIKEWTIVVFDEYRGYPWWKEGEHKALLDYAEKYWRKFKYVAYNSNYQQVMIKFL